MSNITLYVYNNVGDPTEMVYCVHCGRTLMAVRGRVVQWVTSSGAPYNQIASDINYISHICHRCHTTYTILLQTSERSTISAEDRKQE